MVASRFLLRVFERLPLLDSAAVRAAIEINPERLKFRLTHLAPVSSQYIDFHIKNGVHAM